MALPIVFIQRHLPRLNRELPAARHGVGGIDHQIDENLLELRRIHHDEADPWRERNHQVDMLEYEPLEHRLHAADDHVDVENFRLQDLFSAEGEELSREARSTFSRLLDLEQVRTPGILGIWF